MRRLLAIGLVWFSCALAWALLGGTLVVRSGEAGGELTQEVHKLWGPPLEQASPSAFFREARRHKEVTTTTDREGRAVTSEVEKESLVEVAVPLEASTVEVGLALVQRQKGLMWFPTYGVDFAATFAFENPSSAPQEVTMHLPLAGDSVGYDGFEVTAGGHPLPTSIEHNHAQWTARFKPNETRAFQVRYRSRGVSTWSYVPSQDSGQVRRFHLTVHTDFRAVDFPVGSLSPTRHGPEGTAGWKGEWSFESLISSAPLGVTLPQRLNPGPLASRITFFAPVGLLFFFFVVTVLASLRSVVFPPVNYFFFGCAFFAFHLLFAYLVDHLSLGCAFLVATAVSIFLVVTYARLFTGWKFAVLTMGGAQLIYLVLFSWTFFWEGFTGLAITVGAILTLFVMMQVTGRLGRPAPAAAVAPPGT